jgi:hypothetical protein
MIDDARAPLNKFFLRSLIGAGFVMLAAFVTTILFNKLNLNNIDLHTRIVARSFLPGQIALLSFFIFGFVQLYMYDKGRSLRRLAGGHIMSGQQGHAFALALDRDGVASCTTESEYDVDTREVCRGRWLRFPEGIVLHWVRQGDNGTIIGDVGLIFSSGDDLIYEGYEHRIGSRHLFAAQLNVRLAPEMGDHRASYSNMHVDR